jgi:hypothetical protein
MPHPALDQTVAWRPHDDPEHPWRAEVDHAEWLVRVNDEDSHPEHTLLVNGDAVASFDEWPANWYRPLPNRPI